MKWITNRIIQRAQARNPGEAFESPEDRAFAVSAPTSKPARISDGQTRPRMAKFGPKTQGIIKSDPVSTVMEPMAYHLSKLSGAPVPRTVLRTLPDAKGKPQLHSVQERVPGQTHREIEKKDVADGTDHLSKLFSHPQYFATAWGDWWNGQNDRHPGNIMMDPKTNQVQAIDSGEMGHHSLTGENPTYKMSNGLVHSSQEQGDADFNLRQIPAEMPIPQDFRDRVVNTPYAKHAEILDSYLDGPEFDRAHNFNIEQAKRGPSRYPHLDKTADEARAEIKQGYQNHYETMQHHLRQPEVRTHGDLYRRVYPRR